MQHMEQIIIGVDPHKLSATIEVVDRHEQRLGSGRFMTDRTPALSLKRAREGTAGRLKNPARSTYPRNLNRDFRSAIGQTPAAYAEAQPSG